MITVRRLSKKEAKECDDAYVNYLQRQANRLNKKESAEK